MHKKSINVILNISVGLVSAYFTVLFLFMIASNATARFSFSLGNTSVISTFTIGVFALLILSAWHYAKSQQRIMLGITVAGFLSYVAILSGLFV